jgi:hypothetical protein
MKSKSLTRGQNQKPTSAVQPAAVEKLNQNKIDFLPSHEVAGRAYANYLNQGSQHGNDVEHWLDAESQLLAERNFTRTPDYPNRE